MWDGSSRAAWLSWRSCAKAKGLPATQSLGEVMQGFEPRLLACAHAIPVHCLPHWTGTS